MVQGSTLFPLHSGGDSDNLNKRGEGSTKKREDQNKNAHFSLIVDHFHVIFTSFVCQIY